MQHLLYSMLTWLLLPFGLCRLWLRGRTAPAYRRRWRERLGLYASRAEPDAPRRVIFHAVSVGEVHAAQPLLDRFLAAHPDQPVLVTTATPTGAARVHALYGDRVEHVYLPWDLPGATRRFAARFRPRLLVLLETELWPNLLRACARQDCPVVLANARLSAKSCRGYERFGGLTRAMLARVALVAAQSEADATRFRRLGLAAERVTVNGSLKFDVAVDTGKVDAGKALKSGWSGRPVWIAASTREGEDALVLAAHTRLRQSLPDALLVLVPRHPERFTQATGQAREAGFAVQRYSQGDGAGPDTAVLVGDSLGDMALYYSLADVAYVGGSLVPTGCQNIIEPAALGLPVITGPSLYNFRQAADLLQAAGAMQVVDDVSGLVSALATLLQDAALRGERGAAARTAVAQNQGATDRLAALLESYYAKG